MKGGVDYEIQLLAVERASEILFETVGGEFGSIQETKLNKELPKSKKISVDLTRANKILGTNISSSKANKYLKGLGMNIKINDGLISIDPAIRRNKKIKINHEIITPNSDKAFYKLKGLLNLWMVH